MRVFFILLIYVICSGSCFGLATDLLYTGTALTVPPGQVQFQSYYNSSFGGGQRVAGGSLTIGATQRIDSKVGYGYLWNDVGPDVRLGPNAGVKWRFWGDGLVKPAMSVSGLFAVGTGAVGQPHANDYGGLFILQYPTKPMIYLLNVGHVWAGNQDPNLLYTAFAAGHFSSKHTLLALEYASVERLTDVPGRPRKDQQFTAAVVYTVTQRLGYSAQLSYLPESKSFWHLTLGFSTYL